MATAKAGAHIAICAKKVGGVRVLRAQELSKNDAKNTDEVYVLHAQEVSRNNVKNRIRERGVTLIALVVTVIVLLILAGVTITAITGDNGIIKQAQDAAEATEKAQAIEKVEMAILQSFGKDGEIDKDKLIENLQDVDGIDSSTIPSDSDFDFPLTIVVDDYEVVIEENGDVHIEGEEGGSTNTTPGGNTNTNPGGNTSDEDNETGGGNTSGDENETGGNNGTGDTNTTNEIEIPDAETSGVIEVSGPTWSNGTASITISKGAGVDSSLKMQYKKTDQGDDQYVTVNGNSETISGLTDGDVIIVRLTDGKGNYGGVKTINIEDANKPAVVVSQGAVTETSISVTVNATDSESGIPSPASYRYYIKKNTDADYPTQPEATDGNAGYTFNGLDDNTSYDIKVEVDDNAGNTGSDELKGVKTLITIPAGDVEGAIKLEGPTWTEGKASISVSIGDDVDDSLYLEYKKGETGEYTRLEGDTIGDLVSGDKIYIHLTDGTRDGADKIVDISDTKSPTVTVTNGTITTNSITVNVVATDGESGMPNPASYKYYIAKADGGSYAEEPDGGPSESATHTFTNLEANVTYNIRVEVSDVAGNNGTGTTTATTGTMPDAGAVGSLTWGGIVWNPAERTASTTISKGADVDESLQLQYQIVANSETQPVEGSYQIIDNGGTVSGIKNGNVVYARLWDGKNGGKAASLEVRDTNPPTVNVTEGTVGETSISVNVSASDNEAGMPDTITYKYYIKKNEDPDYPSQPEDTNTTGSYTFEGLDDNTGYDMKVEVDDYAGNTGTGELIGIRTLITIPEGNVEGAINVTDPVWSGGQATITVTKGENVDDSLYLEYRKGETGEYAKLEGTAISNLVNGDKIYIHLTDGTRDGTDKVITISDTTGPTVSVTQGTVTTNSITVNVNANDAESGMPAQPIYEYYIKESTTQAYPSTPDGGASTDASHTFTGLKQNISYDIQVKTSDIAGNPGAGTITIKTGTVPDAGDGQTGSIIWSNVNWNPSQGTASITVSKGAGVDESLQIQYQVVANGTVQPQEDSYTTIGNGGTIPNLTHGSVVYARLWDGTNGGNPATQNIQDNVKPRATIQFTENTADVDAQITATVTQTDDESGVASGKYIFNTVSGNIGTDEASYTGTITGTTITVSASAEGTYYLHVLTIDRAGNKKETISGAVTIKSSVPGDVEGMTQTGGDEGTGIVATDNKNNEWVWVEVPKSIYTTAKSDTDYTNIYNDMKTYTNSYKNNSYTDTYISNNGNFSNSTAYNNEKNRMLKSVYDNGGFWISRYEIGTTNASQAVSSNTTSVTTPVSQQNAYPIVNKTQPQSQQIVRKMNSQANLLFGVQWDLTLKFLEVKGGLSVSQLNSDSTSWGNYYNASFTINRGQYQTSWSSTSWTNASGTTKPSSSSWKLTTGAADRNRKMNIYDLAGNVWEWTLESNSLSYVVFRGGVGDYNGNYYPAGYRNNYTTSNYNDYIGLRAALY